MSLVQPIEYENASEEVRAVYDDIMAKRGIDWINNFWKVIANEPKTLRRTWESLQEVMGPGVLDPLVKEMIYLAVSATNACEYCLYSHTAAARAKGMSEAMLGELMAVVAMAGETNRLATSYQVPVDAAFEPDHDWGAGGGTGERPT
jgi:AhpD family alkylhydroperoxidase